MRNILLHFILIFCFCGDHLKVECGIRARAIEMLLGPAEAYEESSLLLSVDNTKYCFLANAQFVTNKMNSNYKEFLFACPAESDENLELNEKFSKTKNALFIKKLYPNPTADENRSFLGTGDTIKIIKEECKYAVIPSIIETTQQKLSNPDISLYLVGYEIYLGEEKMESYKIDKYEAAGLKDKRFAWFNLYTIAFNRKTHDAVGVFSNQVNGYKINLLPEDDTTPKDKIKLDYFLGTDKFYGENFKIAAVYKEVPQTSLFDDLFEGMTLSNDYNFLDWTQNRYLEGVHLAPLESFGIPLFGRAAQTFANMAPMWNMIYKLTWSRIEDHVKYLVKGLKGINVTTGTYGVSILSGVELYLQPDTKNVKVPAEFWKIISYSTMEGSTYNILIATRNNPYEKTEEMICTQNECKNFGWDTVQQDFVHMGLTSCCQVTEQILAKLQIERCLRLGKALNLYEVPHWKKDELTLDVKKYLKNQFNGIDVDKPIDDDIYKNNSEIKVEANEDEEITWREFLSTMYENYVSPLLFSVYARLPSFTNEEKAEDIPAISDVNG